jgi:predicted ATPase
MKEETMKLHIENFAKIKEADIEMNGITVIAGKNGTGKSTLGKLLYSIFTTFNDLDKKINYQKIGSIEEFIYSRIRAKNQVMKRLESGLFEIIEENDVDTIDIGELETLINDVLNNNSIRFDTLEDKNEVIDYILKVIKMDEEKIINTIFNRIINLEFWGQYLPLREGKGELKATLEIKNKRIQIQHNDVLEELVVNSEINLYSKPIYIDNLQVLDVLSEPSAMYSGSRESKPWTHEDDLFLKLLANSRNKEDIIEETIRKEKNTKILSHISQIVDGDFVAADGSISFQEKGMTKALKTGNLSMGIKSFAIIKRLLELGHLTDKGVLILDEPEVHLHPEWQLKYAEILVLLQQEYNLTILINSHSPYFINAIEVYAAKYSRGDKCTYYLAKDEDGMSVFEDVTLDIEKIYSLLAEPLNYLNRMTYENK